MFHAIFKSFAACRLPLFLWFCVCEVGMFTERLSSAYEGSYVIIYSQLVLRVEFSLRLIYEMDDAG